MNVTIASKMKIPRAPNFIYFENGMCIPLCALTPAGVEQLIEGFRDAVLKRHAEQSNDKEFFFKQASKG